LPTVEVRLACLFLLLCSDGKPVCPSRGLFVICITAKDGQCESDD
jgi:hypothetical protein